MKIFRLVGVACLILGLLIQSEARSASENSTFKISSSPAGANVYLDDEFKGRTPLSIEYLKNRSYFVKLTKRGYEDLISAVDVNTNTFRSYKLKRVSVAGNTNATPAARTQQSSTLTRNG